MIVLLHYRKSLSKHRWQLMQLPNVVGVGIGSKRVHGEDTGRMALAVFVSKKLPEEALPRAHRIPKRIDGLPTDVVCIGEVRFLDERVKRHRPAYPGLSIGHYKVSAGTFGAVVYDKRTGEPLILSNNHVLASSSNGNDGLARPGDPVLQPGDHDGGTVENDAIGVLERFIPVRYNAQEAPCPIARGFEKALNLLIRAYRPRYFVKVYKHMEFHANLVDAALARPHSPDLISPAIPDIGPVEGIAEPRLHMKVRKSGRTTGLTTGQILYLDATITVKASANQSALFEDQIVCSPMSLPGDSGSLVLTEDNKAVGLLFAGSTEATILNNIRNVAILLGVKF